MRKNVAIAALTALCIMLGVSLVHTENQRYAMSIGMCAKPDGVTGLTEWDWSCMRTVQTRTGWWWHLFYAVGDAL